MSFEAAAELIRARVASARIGMQALVSMGRLRSINVMLAGEVRSLGPAPFPPCPVFPTRCLPPEGSRMWVAFGPLR